TSAQTGQLVDNPADAAVSSKPSSGNPFVHSSGVPAPAAEKTVANNEEGTGLSHWLHNTFSDDKKSAASTSSSGNSTAAAVASSANAASNARQVPFENAVMESTPVQSANA